jgi:hypothetical protein
VTPFHDAHAHLVEEQVGGLLIALEGDGLPAGIMSSEEVLAAEERSRGLVGVPYVRSGEDAPAVEGPVAKYHARREGYSPNWVASDIERAGRRLVVVDTLNALDWAPSDYAGLALRLPHVQFVMCHAGGYDVLEFVKLCRFTRNVWLDFSVTQHIFGWVDGNPSPAFISECVDHALRERRIADRVMFGSDTPWYPQLDAVERAVERARDAAAYLGGNFERLLEVARL